MSFCANEAKPKVIIDYGRSNRFFGPIGVTMQELTIFEIDEVAGGKGVVSFALNVLAGVIGNAVYSSISGINLSGGSTNSGTDALGNMY